MLSQRKTVSGWFTAAWTNSFEGKKIPHRKQDCLEYKNEKIVLVVLKNLM